MAEDEKQCNRGLGRFRVGVEHRIGRCKRFRIVSERCRNPRRTHHTRTAVVAGLVNIEAGFTPIRKAAQLGPSRRREIRPLSQQV